MKADISPAQLVAARALVGWSRDRLGREAQMTSRTIARMEAGETQPYPRTVAAIRAALEAAGVEFIEENGGGPGVRLRRPMSPAEELAAVQHAIDKANKARG